jgi:diguanylate cyclase (GGDEF)-like protein
MEDASASLSGGHDPLSWRHHASLKASAIEALRWLRPEGALKYSNDVASEQAWLLARICYVYAIFGTTSVTLIAAAFRSRLGLLGFSAAAALPILYGALLLRVRDLHRFDDASAFLRSALFLLSFVGIAWGLLIYSMGLVSDPIHQRLLVAIMVGLVSTPIITVPFSAALAFLVPCGVASVLTLGFILKPFDLFLFSCFTGYLSFTYVSTVLLNRSSLERAATRIRLQHQNEVISLFLRDYQENATDWLWETDTELRFQNISPRFANSLAVVPASLRGMPLRRLAADERITGLSSILDMCDARQAFRDVVVRFDFGQNTRWWSVTGQPVYDTNARFQGYRGIGSDITEVRRSENQIKYLANHDSLTGLPNRARFIMELEEFCLKAASALADDAQPGQAAGPPFALLLVDLDRFKEVNDTHGHATGDALLIAVAERMRRVLRSGGFPARLGGDEFAILLPISDPEDASVVAGRIIQTLQEPYAFRDVTLRPGASVGITVAPTDGTDPPALMRNADLALYAVKAEGRGAWSHYRPGMDAEQTDRATLRTELKSAVAANDFHLEYQPILDLATMEVVAVEALIRWNHRIRGLVSPSVFIPIAEESGLISGIGVSVLNRACDAAAGWPAHVRLSVNVSALQFREPNFLSLVDRALLASGLAPNRLEVELTERVLLDENENSFLIIASLHQRGVRIILDDFGTGYSSLATLTRFDFDGLKIDGTFTAALEEDAKARAIVRSIGRIAADMALPVTAEGIETPGQLRLVKELGISRGQGFFIGRPQGAGGLLPGVLLAAGTG